jgi:hypothetical protein
VVPSAQAFPVQPIPNFSFLIAHSFSAFGSSFHDNSKLVCFQGCAADQAAVNIGLGEQFLCVFGVHAAAKALTVQYGGSMNPKNAEELLSKPDVDGGLIGGASLKADQFAVIVEAATKG